MSLRDKFPPRTLTLPTSLAPADAAAALARHLGEDRAFRGTRQGDLRFEITRVIAYRNSFSPLVLVTFEPRERGAALVRVHMRLHPLVSALNRFMLAFSAMLAILGVALAVTSRQLGWLAMLTAPVGFALLPAASFSYEAARAEALLRDIFSP